MAVEMVLRGLNQEKAIEIESEIDLIPRLRGITTDEELEEDVVDSEVPGAAQSPTPSDTSSIFDAVENIVDLIQVFSN